MRKIKASLAGFILFVLIASGSFITCDIGLGNSVDTKPPTVSITYPPTVSIIRGDFVVAGNAADETSLSSVLITMTARTGSATGSALKTWSAQIPQPLSDGDYDVTAEAIDNANRKTSVKISYKIDNTPPVLVVQRPSTKGNLLVTGEPDNLDGFDPFGSEIAFSGNLWDGNEISLMNFNFYDKTGTLLNPTPYTYTPPTQNWDVTITDPARALMVADVALALNNPQPYWYTISASDNALEYSDPLETSLTAGKTGNTTSHYYKYVDLAALLGPTDSYPKLTNLSRFENDPTQTASIPSAMTTAALAAIRISSNPADFSIETNGNFSFDPLNKDPSINIESLPVSAPVPSPSDNGLPPAATLNIQVKPNKDNILLDQDSIAITLTAFNDDGTLNTSSAVTKTGSELRKVVLGTLVSINYPVEKSAGQYQLEVYAEDIQGNDVRTKYGFNINTGAPSFLSVSPDKSPSITKVNSYTGTDGTEKFKVVIKGTDGDAGVILSILENSTN